MAGKVSKILISVVASFVFFVVLAIVLDSLAGVVFGNKANGDANVNGHVMLTITTLITIGFGIWFYKYVHLGKGKNTKEND